MNRDSDRQKLFTRRVAVLGAGKAALLTALSGRMYYLQVVQSERYATLAEENRINFRLLAPPRGRILDRRGAPVADNRHNYRALLIAENVPGGEISKTLDKLSLITPLDEHDRKRILREVKRNRKFVPVTMLENLRWEDLARIEVNTPNLPGVIIDVGQSRYYPDPEGLSHILGYVAAVSESELKAAEDPLLSLPDFRIGKSGVERMHDKPLRGLSGASQVEVNAFGRIIRELSRDEGEAGAEVRLTIDASLQAFITRRLGGESGSCVVMDVHSGEVLALVSTPGFDPNAFSRGMDTGEWKRLINDPFKPLTNKAVAGRYPPGSTFKMAVALAALERGAVTPDTTVNCRGFTQMGDSRFHCWRSHGPVSLHRALQQSCDVYFYETALRTGIDRIAAMARRLGMGETTGIDLPGESSGLVPDKAWLLTTPLQLCVMTARMVNGGRAVRPRVTASVRGLEIPQAPAPDLNLPHWILEIVRAGMNAAVNVPGGTAFGARIRENGMQMGGKTGTAQVRRITKAERARGVRKNEDLPWKFRDHALFVGYAPTDAPRFAAAVVVEHGGGGSKAAAPVARDVLLETQRLMQKSAARTGAPGTTPGATEG
ncbi:MAG: penicillin-binding protein 2 [Rhodospirillales bacterium]